MIVLSSIKYYVSQMASLAASLAASEAPSEARLEARLEARGVSDSSGSMSVLEAKRSSVRTELSTCADRAS